MHPALQMFLEKVRGLRNQVTALYLFGSRARGDWRPDSDFDVLVILPERKQALVDQLYDAVLDVNLETGLLISLKILTGAQYEKLAAIPTPFLANVAAEGVRLGLDD
ncbi:MAG: nucleotidyltransferase domain-containing protein [Spirochaetia bacterium]